MTSANIVILLNNVATHAFSTHDTGAYPYASGLCYNFNTNNLDSPVYVLLVLGLVSKSVTAFVCHGFVNISLSSGPQLKLMLDWPMTGWQSMTIKHIG
jgi:hypothetical protein